MNKNDKINWQTKKISDVAKICLGLTHTPRYVESGVPFLSVKDITKGHISFANTRFITRSEFNSLPDGAKPQKDDVLFCRVGTIGFPQIIHEDKEFGIFVSLGFFRVKKDILFNKYIFYWMQSPLFDNQVSDNVQGSTLKNLNTGWLKNFDILLPSLPEQQRIVKILDEVFEKIELAKKNIEKNLQNSKDLFGSYLNNVFNSAGNNWEIIDLEDSIEKIVYTNKIQKNKFLKTGKFPIISQEKDLINGYWNKENDLFYIKKPCIIFGDHTKIVKYVDFSFVLGADGVKILQPKDIIYPKFFFYFLSSIRLKNLGYSRHYRLLKEKKVIFPKLLSEQKSIVTKLDKLSIETRKLETMYEQKLDNLEELKKSVLKKAFSGEL